MANLRTFYACQAVAIGAREPDGNGNYPSLTRPLNYIHGVQSVGLNSTFDVENVFELGQLEIYESVLNIPQIEVTIEKVLDGYETPYYRITDGDALALSSKYRADVQFNIFADTGNAQNTTGVFNMLCTGMYVTNVTYTFPVDGNCTESITLVGNSKQLGTGAMVGLPSGITNGTGVPDNEPFYNYGGNAGSGQIIRRQDVTVTCSGANGSYSPRAQNVTLTLNLGREDVFEFGRRLPYAKLATYPIEVTAEIQSLLTDDNDDDAGFTESTVKLPIKDVKILVQAGTGVAGTLTVDLGEKAYLSSVNQTGGDATGGNATITRSFTTYNTFTVTGTSLDQTVGGA